MKTLEKAFQATDGINQAEVETCDLSQLMNPFIRDIAGIDGFGTQEVGDNERIPFIRLSLADLPPCGEFRSGED